MSTALIAAPLYLTLGRQPCARRPSASSFGLRRMDPRGPAIHGRGQAAQPEAALRNGDLREAGDDAAVRVSRRLVELRHRREPRQAQHLRLPDPRLRHLHAGSGGGEEGAAGVQVGPHPHQAPQGHLHARRHVVLGARGQRRREERHPHRAITSHGDVPRDCWAAPPCRNPGTMGTFTTCDPSLLRGGRHRVRGLLEAPSLQGAVSTVPQGPPNRSQEETALREKKAAAHERRRKPPPRGLATGKT